MVLLSTSAPATFSTAVMNGDQNLTNTSGCPDAEKQQWHITVLPPYIWLISVLGILLNVFVLGVFCLHKKACSVAEIFLSNMAAADLILTAFIPFWAVWAAKGFEWPFADALCPILTHAVNMNAYCSIYFLVLISIDRYLALVHPLVLDGIRRPKYAKLGCLLVWCFGSLLGVPNLVYRKATYSSAAGYKLCFQKYPTATEQNVIQVMLIMFSFVIPVSIISFCTFRIIRALNNRVTVRSNTKKMEHKATTLVLAVLLAFMICWVPFHLNKIVDMFKYTGFISNCTLIFIHNIFSHIGVILALFNSVLNPVLYVMVGQNFRNKVRELFKQRSTDRTTTYTTGRSSCTRLDDI